MNRRLDLLAECNDQHLAPAEFKQMFCSRCRNQTCVNAGWAGSTWADRMSTQVQRLFQDVATASSDDARYARIRAALFVPVAPPVALIGGQDPWAPQVVLATPPTALVSSSPVDYAVAKLNGTEIEDASLSKVPSEELLPSEKPRELLPLAKAPPPSSTKSLFNTPFPDEGQMLDGGPAPSLPAPSRSESKDPWAPPEGRKIAVGGKIRMDG